MFDSPGPDQFHGNRCLIVQDVLYWHLMNKHDIVDGKAWCRFHRDFLPVSCFSKYKKSLNGLLAYCKECRKERRLPKRKDASVAEMDQALDYESSVREFESLRAHQSTTPNKNLGPRLGFKRTCPKCNEDIGTYGFNRHVAACLGSGKQKTHKYPINPDGTVTCPECSKLCRKTGIGQHIMRAHRGHSTPPPSWNKGKTKDTDPRIAAASLKVTGRPSNNKGVPHTQKTKNKLSIAMKKAHADGRGWHIGKMRNERKPSYPEQFFMQVVANEFIDKNYVQELRVSKYAIDFAWVEKKIAIEIDGQFHLLPEYVERDARKDAYLISQGWSILRMPWKQVCADPKPWIELAKQHVHG